MAGKKAGKKQKYRLVDGTSFHIETPDEVVRVLQEAINQTYRMRIFYGDPETGRDWCEEHGMIGYVRRSNGRIKVPILLYRRDTMGAPAIMDHRIVKIVRVTRPSLKYHKGTFKTVEYQHPKYHLPGNILSGIDFTQRKGSKMYFAGYIKPDNSLEVMARFEEEKKAEAWVRFITGEIMVPRFEKKKKGWKR